mmetsp:Transcript_81076/g.235146  ORF Transcript_81076/g.235146 Transcript_81076/m.235146 type:complete len:339 (+) Transcript_81076:1726-2742(+)
MRNDGDCHYQPSRSRGHEQADIVVVRARVHGVLVASGEGDGGGDHDDDDADAADHLAEIVDGLLQWVDIRRGVRRFQPLGDEAHLRVHACRDDLALSAAGDHAGAAVEHVRLEALIVVLLAGLRGLRLLVRLAGEHGLVGLQVHRVEDDHVRRHHVAHVHFHDVTDDKLAHLDLRLPAGPHGGDRRARHLLAQLRARVLGRVLPDGVDAADEDDDADEHGGLDTVAHGVGHARGAERQEEDYVLHLSDEDAQEGLRRRSVELVRPVLGQPPCRLLVAEALGLVGAEGAMVGDRIAALGEGTPLGGVSHGPGLRLGRATCLPHARSVHKGAALHTDSLS